MNKWRKLDGMDYGEGNKKKMNELVYKRTFWLREMSWNLDWPSANGQRNNQQSGRICALIFSSYLDVFDDIPMLGWRPSSNPIPLPPILIPSQLKCHGRSRRFFFIFPFFSICHSRTPPTAFLLNRSFLLCIFGGKGGERIGMENI